MHAQRRSLPLAILSLALLLVALSTPVSAGLRDWFGLGDTGTKGEGTCDTHGCAPSPPETRTP